MRTVSLALALATGIFAASAAPLPARAADIVHTHRLSAALATDIAIGAIAACTKLGYPITAAVVDADGVTQALIRGDGAGVHTVQAARDKAFTAVTYGRATSAVAAQFKDHFSGVIQKEPYLIAGEGGLPIAFGSSVIAALGVSGSPGKDEECGHAALDAVAARLK
jgi:uncharacterized protein GlcG (DUF336 family)